MALERTACSEFITGRDELVADPLVIALRVVVPDVLAQQPPKVALADRNDLRKHSDLKVFQLVGRRPAGSMP